MTTSARAPHRLGRWVKRAAAFIAVVLLLGFIAFFADSSEDGILARFLLKPGGIIVEQRPDPAYEQLFPYYVDLCTVSQWRRLDGTRGNPFGHAAMYVKGACKDETAPYPQLRRCRGIATDVSDPEHGAGVSVGRWFRNINWVAVPGYELFYSGNLKPGERLTRDYLEATAQKAIDLGVFDGVELHDRWTRDRTASLHDFVASRSIGTDFALQFARNVFCARLPVNEEALDEIIAFLNDKNHEYATGKADYNWNLLANNCVHTVRNALAAANVWAPLSVLQTKLLHVFNMAVPSHEFVNLAVLGSEGPLSDYDAIYNTDPSRDALQDFEWLPTRHGALVKTLPVHQPNDIYRSDFRLFTVQSPFHMARSADAVRLLSDRRTVDLAENLKFFIARYDDILARHREELDPMETVRGSPWRRFGRLYSSYIQQQRDDAAAKLEQLERIESGPSTQPAPAQPESAAQDSPG